MLTRSVKKKLEVLKKEFLKAKSERRFLDMMQAHSDAVELQTTTSTKGDVFDRCVHDTAMLWGGEEALKIVTEMRAATLVRAIEYCFNRCPDLKGTLKGAKKKRGR